jgi:hypothetical protein
MLWKIWRIVCKVLGIYHREVPRWGLQCVRVLSDLPAACPERDALDGADGAV